MRTRNRLHVPDKAHRVATYHHKTVHAALEICGAAGYASPAELTPSDVWRRVTTNRVLTYAELYPTVEEGCLVKAGGKDGSGGAELDSELMDNNRDGRITMEEFWKFEKAFNKSKADRA